MPEPKNDRQDFPPVAPRVRWWMPLLLVLPVIAAYQGSFEAPLLFDDAGAITHNESIRQFATALHPPADGSTTTGRPVLNLVFALNYALTGDSLAGWHWGNLLIHAAAVVLLFYLLRAVLLRPVFRSWGKMDANWIAFAVALIWGVHPLSTESVVCIAQRSETLCALFYFGVLFCFMQAAARPVGRRWAWYGGAVALAWVGMGAKEVMVTVPLMVLLFDRTFFFGGFAPAWRERRGFYLALTTSWLLLAFLLFSGGGTRGSSAGLGLGVGTWPYLLKQCEAIVLYLRLSVWPSPLVLDYGIAVVDSVAEVWWQATLVAVALCGTLWLLGKRPLLGLAGAWFFVVLAPSSSFVPLVAQTVAEHRMYLPVAGLVAAFGISTWRWVGRWALLPLAVLAVLFSAMTLSRVRVYGSVIGIWQDSVASYPQSGRAQLNLGVELLNAKRWSEARRHLLQAAELLPGYALAHYNCGLAWQTEGHFPEALAEYEKATQLAPGNPDMRVNLGNALVQVGRTAEALPHYEEALRLKPAADVHYNLAQALIPLNRTAEAAQHFEEAVRLEPGHTDWQKQLALWYAQSAQWQQAAVHFQALVRLHPDDADLQANYGNVLLLSGRVAEAVERYEAALRLRPGDARTLENLRLARAALR